MNENTILKIENLNIVYNPETDPVQAVKSVSLYLREGESIGIMGESGCGKTTIAMSILDLINSPESTSGSIRFRDTELIGLQEKELNKIRWKKIAISFQNSLDVLNPVMSVGSQIEEAIRYHFDLSDEAIKTKVEEIFDLIELDRIWIDAYPHELSGGMRQKVIFGMAISCNPEILILDEPTTALDSANKDIIVKLIKRLRAEHGFSMIVISHDIDVIRELSDRLYVMYAGRICEIGPTKLVMEEPLHPYTRGLFNSSPAMFRFKDLSGMPTTLENKSFGKDACPFACRCPQSSAECNCIPELAEISAGRSVACVKGGIEVLMNVRNIVKTYKTSRRTVLAVDDASFDVKSGEVVAIIGKSGSGKSTLAQIMVGLLDYESGSIIYRGKEIRGSELMQIKQGVQIVLQDANSSISSHMTVLQAATEALRINKLGSAEDNKNIILKLLGMVQLPSDDAFLSKYCSELSGGQRQRLSIVRALAMDPKILIADEITSMLDPSTQANIMKELKEIQNKFGFTVLFITHDMHLARKVADRVIVISEGRIVSNEMAYNSDSLMA